VALLLAMIGVWRGPQPLKWVYLALTLVLVELSFGFNGFLYPRLHAYVFALEGLRATARMALVASVGLAVLAAFGFAAVQPRVGSSGRRKLLAACLLVLTVEYASLPLRLVDVSSEAPQIYQLLRRLPPGPVVEIPPGDYDTVYMVSSISHWNPLVNGYSGFIPQHYLDTMRTLQTFPDDRSIAHLESLGVRYVIVHESQYEPDDFVELMLAMRRRPELVPLGRYKDERLGAELFELRDHQPNSWGRPGR
jgi:hypothetical protein